MFLLTTASNSGRSPYRSRIRTVPQLQGHSRRCTAIQCVQTSSRLKPKLCDHRWPVGHSVLHCSVLMWDTLPHRKADLYVTIAAGSRQSRCPAVTPSRCHAVTLSRCPAGLKTVFYCPKWQTPATWRSRSPTSVSAGNKMTQFHPQAPLPPQSLNSCNLVAGPVYGIKRLSESH
jgi:hypothetical protein